MSKTAGGAARGKGRSKKEKEAEKIKEENSGS